MFKPEKDERLWRIELEAGMAAFLTYFFVNMGLMIARGVAEIELLSNPDFLLMVPWALAGIVFYAVEMKKGYFATVREENARLMSIRSSRGTLLATVVGVAIISFVFNRVNLFSDEVETVTVDLMDACIFALMYGALFWFLEHRRPWRKKRDNATSEEVRR